MGPTWLNGLFLLLLKKAEIDSAREAYSSSPSLEDCILPLFPESIFLHEKDMYAVRFLLMLLVTHTQTPFKKGEKEPPKQSVR